ncbi:Cysteine protease atg4b [Linnemannia zychae]|nr:Cysteine protease atg4b [Linnemannia zychae]
MNAATIVVSSSPSSTITPVARSSSPYHANATINTAPAEVGSIQSTLTATSTTAAASAMTMAHRPARTKIQLSKTIRPPPVSAPSSVSVSTASTRAFTPSRQTTKSVPPNSRDDLEFWASLYAQHTVITQQRHEPAALSPPRTANSKKGGPFVKIWQVMRKTYLKGEVNCPDRFRFETLAPEETPTTTTATKISPHTSSFSVVVFFTVEEGESKDGQQKTGSSSRNSKRWSLPPTLQLWCVESARNRNRMLFNQKELMGSFVPNALSFQPNSNGHDLTAPLYIYETQTLGLDAVSLEGPIVLELKLQSTEGAIYADFFYLFVQEKEGAAGANNGKFIETTVTPRPQGVESKNFGSNGAAGDRRQLVLGFQNNDSITSSIGSVDSELDSYHHKNRGEWDMTEDEMEDAEEDEDEEEELGLNERMSSDSKDKKKMLGGPDEPDAGEHLMQATSQFFSKMGYWLYNSRVVQYISRDERTRIKTAFQPEDIWMLGICYNLQLQPENNAINTAIKEDPMPEKKGRQEDTAINAGGSEAPPLPNGDAKPSEQPQSHRSVSLSKLTGAAPERSLATSSISHYEAQSHSHPRTTTPDNLSDSGATSAIDYQPLRDNNSPSSASSPKTKKSSRLSSKFSKLSLDSESSLTKESAVQSRLSPEAGVENAKTIHTPPSPRKQKRRMTISGLFSWDSSSDAKNLVPPVPALPTNSSVLALKNLVRSSTGKNPQTTVTPSTPDQQSLLHSTVSIDPEFLEDDDFAEVDYPPELAARPPTTESSLKSIPERPSIHPLCESHEYEPKTTFLSSSSLSTKEPKNTNSSDTSVEPKRERRRKTTQMMQRPTDLQCTDQLQPTTSLSSTAENKSGFNNSSITYTSRNRRQSTTPISTPAFIKVRPRTATSSISSAPSVSSPALLPSNPPTSNSSSGSTLRRSWRSLSLSLASAKSALPIVSSSSFSLRSPKLPSQFSESMMRREYGEFGSEEDYFNSTFNFPGAVTLPPSMTASLALLRTSPSSATNGLTPEQAILSQFMMDFQSRLWFTYRKDLARIEPSFYSCDSGWGCMMRTGQSLLAQAFVQVLMGREWKVHHHDQPSQRRQGRRYKEIVNWFVDEPERPYSIHRIAKQGLALDKRIGEWFGPSTVANVLKRLTKSHIDCPLKVIVPMDGTVRISAVLRAASSLSSTYHQAANPSTTSLSPFTDPILTPSHSQSQAWRPVLLLLPNRYGLDKVTGKYLANLKQLFRMPQFLGIAGGRPNRSLYFVASQGDELFYYDPHFVKQRVTPEELNSCPMPSFHCPVVRTMHISELDPSMLLGFLIQSRDELDDLRTRLERDMIDPAYPLLTFVDGAPTSATGF